MRYLWFLLVSSLPLLSNAAVSLFSDQTTWQSSFVDPTMQLTTNGAGIALANEVGTVPGNNTPLGNSLTFNSANTGFGFDFTVAVTQVGVSGDGFTFNDTEGSSAWLTGVLSVGDIDNAQDDGFEITSSTPLYGLSLDFIGNEFSAGETISLYNGTTLVATFTSAGEIPDDPGTPQRTFWGVTSEVPFTRFVFDESPDGDDMGIADFGFATTAPIPEPGTTALMVAALCGLFLLERCRKDKA